MNGQYQQPTDSLNNDNKYVGLVVWVAAKSWVGLKGSTCPGGSTQIAIAPAAFLSLMTTDLLCDRHPIALG